MKNTISLVLVLVLGLASEVANADFTFGEPTNLGPIVNSSTGDGSPSISADGLSLYFTSNRPGGLGEYDLWVSTRPTRYAAWGPAVNLGSQVNSQYTETDPSISSDGLSLYFSDPHKGIGFGRPRPGGFAAGDGGNVWVVTRATVDDPWSAPVNLGPALNSRKYDQVVHPSISADGLSLYVHACAQGIGVAKRASTAEPFETPELLMFPGNNGANDWWPNISADGRTLFFSVWSWTTEVYQLWVTTRPTADSDFGLPTKLPAPINIPDCLVFCPNASADGSTLYFTSDRPGGVGSYDLWQVSISPVVDFNGDLKVDLADMHIMVDHWGEDYPLCDIGPMPWGDSIVDVQDMIVLAEHLFEDYRLIAHWKLDETEGSVAYDSAGDHDGTLNSNPFWQSTGGMIGSTLLFDGVDDYISTPFILNPAEGSFSVFAWIYGWTPGQVIISQTGDFGGTWLGTNPSEGKLMTGFSDQYFGTLESESVITDVQWHHVGLVYDLDSLHRRLYVDGAQVAEDTTVVSGMPSDGGLYIGASKDLDAGTFFSGMIDDVRIYDVALTAEEIEALAR